MNVYVHKTVHMNVDIKFHIIWILISCIYIFILFSYKYSYYTNAWDTLDWAQSSLLLRLGGWLGGWRLEADLEKAASGEGFVSKSNDHQTLRILYS